MARLHIALWGAPDAARILSEMPAERIEIEDGWVPRYAIHRPPEGGGLLPDGSLRAYQPPPYKERNGEAQAIRHLFPVGYVLAEGVVWLAPLWPRAREWSWGPYVKGGFVLDLGACDPARLRHTGQAEGFLVHLGPVPARAVVGHLPSENE